MYIMMYNVNSVREKTTHVEKTGIKSNISGILTPFVYVLNDACSLLQSVEN